MKTNGRFVAVPLAVDPQLVEQRPDIGGRRLLAHVAAGKGQIRLQHRRHLVDILFDGVDFGAVAEQRQFELEPGEDCAQVVRHPGEHGGALLDRPLDAAFHFQEGGGRAPNLAGAARTEVRRLAALAEGFGGVGQAHDRTNLIAQESDGDGEHDQRGRNHPDQENPGIRIVDIGALGEDAHHGVVQLDPNLDDVGAPDSVDPERQPDLLADFVGECAVELRKERLRPRRRQLRAGQEIDHKTEAVLGDAF